jgi:hypothetical protein
MTFVRKHAQGIVACDFFVVVTATFRVLYVFVVMEVGTRRMVHHNVTAYPRAAPPVSADGHEIPRDSRVLAKSILGGLHREHALSKVAA